MVKKYRRDDGRSYALGATVTMELIKRRRDCVKRVYVSPRLSSSAVPDYARENCIEVVESDRAFNILSPKENCFVIGEFDKFDAPIRADKSHTVLVNPSDAGNLGTIMRDVAAFDCTDLVIIRPAVDPFDPRTVRASMGAVFNINFECFDSFDEYLEKFGGREIVPFMLGGSAFGDKTFGKEKEYSLVFGNEAKGLPEEYERFGAVRIEQSDKVDSLNLSVAVSVALYKLFTSK